jgi:hypothetical protein
VRELGEDQEALQLHARALRIRQKTPGVWNVTVAEALYNVSLIYRDLEELDCAVQVARTTHSRHSHTCTVSASHLRVVGWRKVARGCCRIYGAVLGDTHPDSREAEDLLKEIATQAS